MLDLGTALDRAELGFSAFEILHRGFAAFQHLGAMPTSPVAQFAVSFLGALRFLHTSRRLSVCSRDCKSNLSSLADNAYFFQVGNFSLRVPDGCADEKEMITYLC